MFYSYSLEIPTRETQIQKHPFGINLKGKMKGPKINGKINKLLQMT